MKSLWKWTLLLVLSVVLAACSMESPGSTDDNSDDNGDNTEETAQKIGFSISTLNNPFFVTLADGAQEKADELGMALTVVDAQDDPAKQASDMEDLIQQGVSILLVNPTDSAAVSSAIESANNADIPVITVDRNADSGEIITHIASDNIEGGKLAGEFIIEELGGSGSIVELEGIAGSSAARERGEGFNEAISASDIEVVAKQTANFDRAEGLSVMENILQSGVEFQAVFAHNDEMALGALEALQSAGRDDVMIVGFDATDDAVAAVEAGNMNATIAQKPEIIGMNAVETAKQVLDGEEVEDFIPVELEVISQ
ncbi:ribose ABC transporter substrate-binding protein RbsB [Jeotgalibacillus soli]|uniref:D-ribose transporter subunit RbsB n=1 Tax=Jeotgalibacillus soli TaxID=889306 RepID=A0A0C2VL08_9BACL|nr:ribose ABC transporter substrate-binding protein RbsB [Jeotgalibacillus soli]KIL49562.1 D-ribose transporter subunit RbsB [Jeotgalibacillus soli]